MAENRTQDYFDDNNEGHLDTRKATSHAIAAHVTNPSA